MSNNLHIGDLHLGHKGIQKYRDGVSSVEENDEKCLDGVLTTCTKRSVLYLHGDIFFTKESLAHLFTLKTYIRDVRLILGNHDFQHAKPLECLKIISDLGVPVIGLKSTKTSWLSHAPMHVDELRGKINIHGHVHKQTINQHEYVNVSVDNTNFLPISATDILNGWRGM